MSVNKSRLLASLSMLLLLALGSCKNDSVYSIDIYQSSASGDSLKPIDAHLRSQASPTIRILPEERFQTIQGFGGAFTESTAHLLLNMPPGRRESILRAYFGDEGARYSLCRTHINSCDFSLGNYAYVEEGDVELSTFSLEEDQGDIIPLIRAAYLFSSDGFRLIASPWTAPPWMKDNKEWNGGRLLPEFYGAWARYFVLYEEAMKKEGIDIWAFTVENEPLGNGAHWESMHYSPKEMAEFVKAHMAPALKASGSEARILVYDQNRGPDLEIWAEALLSDPELRPLIYGTAVHWYDATVDWFPESLQKIHALAPDKHIVETEGCIDNDIPRWRDDSWYWKREATDWGYQWAKEENKHRHPPYVPVYRYARDIIGCMNNWVEGWVDWNMVLDKQGGPNHAENWCIAPVILDTATEEVYFTPLFQVMTHFSHFVPPGSVRIGFEQLDDSLMVTAFEKEKNKYIVVLLNMNEESREVTLELEQEHFSFPIEAQSIQTIVIEAKSNKR